MAEHTVLIECFRCGYDLHGIADDRPCPECGLLAERSRRSTDALLDARPRWLRKLSLGIWLLLAAVVVGLFSQAINHWLEEDVQNWLINALVAGGGALSGWQRTFVQWWYRSSQTLWLGAFSVLLWLGLRLLTVPEGYAPDDNSDAPRRRGIRLLSLLPMAIFVVWNLLNQTASWNFRPADTIATMLLLALLPLPKLVMSQLEHLAFRTRSRHLAEHCRIVAAGATLTMIMVVLTRLIIAHSEFFGLPRYFSSRGMVSLLIQLISATAAALFWIWMFYVAAQFALSFRRTAKRIRQKWTEADFSRKMSVETP